MRRIFIITLTILILFSNITVRASFELSAESAILIDCETGRIIYEKNKDAKMAMASTTKIITAITAIEHGNLSDVVTVSANAALTEGSSVWLSEGEKLTLNDLLYALMLESGNDASVAIAEHIGGNVEGFSELMNAVCRKAGATSTNCVTPSGLDDELHFTTAQDLAMITRYAMTSDTFREIVSTYKTTIPWEGNEWDRTLVNHNKMLTLYEGADGVKTGYTKKSGRCLVSSAEKDGWRVIAVTLNAPDDWNDHIKMLNFAFDNFKESEKLTECGKSIGKITVSSSKNGHINYGFSEEISVRKLYDEEKIKININVPDEIKAPVYKGDIVGSADLYLNDMYYRTVDLLSLEDAEIYETSDIIFDNFEKLLKTLLSLMR